MKIKQFLLAAFAAMALFSCSKEDAGDEPIVNEGTAYMAITFPDFAQKTRANESNAGSQEESKLNTAVVLLFDKDDKCLGTATFANFTTKPATEVQLVSANTTKVFAIINKNDQFDLRTVKGETWNDIKERLVEVVSTDIATDNNFMMTNSGDITDGGLVAATVYEKAADAKNDPAVILVDRLASKVKVGVANPVTVPNGAIFTFLGWELNTVNKATSLYTEHIKYDNASTSVVAGVYRQDHNYLTSKIPAAGANLIKYMTDNYSWLKNGTKGDGTDMSEVKRPTTDIAYCTENTMDATAQQWGQTTKAVIKSEFTPGKEADGNTLTAKVSYFSWGVGYYSHGGMKTAYKGNSGLKTDLITFLAAADGTFKALDPTAREEAAAIDAAIDRLDDYSGIKARYNAVKYFHKSVCYYDALIRHDSNVTVKMALGRYGVVRNNAYEITINAVNGPGTPWIPDPTEPVNPTDPTDPDKPINPTDPTTPDDEVDANLSVQVKVHDWTIWTHGVELGN